MTEGRVTDYDRVAGHYDTRYSHLSYAGVQETVLRFLGPEPVATLEVGCGTGHWLAALAARPRSAKAVAERPAERAILAGVEPSSEMIARARVAAPQARLVRGRAEALPWQDATFDRIFCVNALHHFADRQQFFAEARRVLKPGGGLLTVGKDPHAERDTWWVYDYFAATRPIDLVRFARVRTLRGELSLAGFAWTESSEADQIEALQPATEALANGIVDPGFTSQLSVLSAEEFARGAQKIRDANAAADGELQLVTDFHLYATIGWT